MTSLISTPPSVLWAQRRTRVFLTFNVECEKPDINIEKKTVTFKGACAPDDKLHEVTIPLYAEVDPGSSSFRNKGRQIEVILAKENPDEPFWPTLTSDNKKHHWLKVDFEHWQDEDEEDSVPDDFDEINDFANKIELNDDADDKDDSSSSDEEDLPDVQ